MKRIKFEIDSQGQIKAEAEGFTGSACEAALEAFKVLKQPDVTVEDKPELWLQPEQQQTLEGGSW